MEHGPQSQADPLDAVVEAFVSALRRGERPDVEEYATRHPGLADRIRCAFPTLLLLEGQGATPATAAATTIGAGEPTPAALGEFRLLREVARGGMGVVYEAVQGPLGRRVALKVLPPHLARDDRFRERFLREARAAARLHHTNIVPVFDSGEHDGTLYFAMQYIDGNSLAAVVAGRGATPLPPREVARLGVQAAEALAYAHAQGILHRDIKPANLLRDVQGTLWVADFGLAKAQEAGELTESGELVGTLRFLAPERFAGRCDARADIYALGTTLYELLTGRPAFGPGDRAALVQQITHVRPPRPRQVAPGVPVDLETVVLKAMAPEPDQRYATAQELAEDLRRFLADLPVKARRASAVERLRHWARREPALARLSAAVVLLLLALLAGAVVAAWRLNRTADRALQAEHDALQAEHQATDRLFEALLTRVEAGRGSGRPGQRLAALEALRHAVAIARDQGRPAADFLRLRNEAIACLALPDLELEREWEGNPPGTTGLGLDTRLKRYTWSFRDEGISVRRTPDQRELSHLPALPSDRLSRWARPVFSPDGRYLAVDYLQWGEKRPVEVWDLEGGRDRPVATVAAAAAVPSFAADGKAVAARLADGAVVLIDLPSGRERRRLRPGAPSPGLALHPGGRLVAVGSAAPARVLVCDLDAGTVVREMRHPDKVTALAWAPDGGLLAVSCVDHRIYLWDGQSGQAQGALEGHRWEPEDLAFDPTGRWLASFGWDMTLRVWDVGARRQVLDLEGIRVVGFRTHDSLAGAGLTGRQVRVWALQPSAVFDALHFPPGVYCYADFSPDGDWATITRPGMNSHLWDVRRHREAASGPELDGFVWGPDGTWYLSWQEPGFLRGRVQRLPGDGGKPAGLRIGPPQRLGGVQEQTRMFGMVWASPGRRLFTTWHSRGRVQMLEVGPEAVKPLWQATLVNALDGAVSPDGRLVAAGSFEGGSGVRIWEADTGRLVQELAIGDACMAFSADSRRLFTTTGRVAPRGAECCAWRVGADTPELALALSRPTSSAAHIKVAPDGTVAVAFTMNDVRLLEPDTLKEIATLTSPDPQLITGFHFSPDGRTLAVISGHTVHFWDLRSLRAELATLGLDWERKGK
jgi:WD40 repeat protein/predicted Ser/Thr protein kinase